MAANSQKPCSSVRLQYASVSELPLHLTLPQFLLAAVVEATNRQRYCYTKSSLLTNQLQCLCVLFLRMNAVAESPKRRLGAQS